MIAVVGVGYVGLELVLAFAEAGVDTVGFDIDESRIRTLDAYRSPFAHVPAERIAAARQARFTANRSRLREADAFLICVPTPLDPDGMPDHCYVKNACATVGEAMRGHSGRLVSLESTVAPGTTEGLARAALEATSGLEAGRDFALVFSPERIDPGRAAPTLCDVPKVVAGLTSECAERAAQLYRRLFRHVVIAPSLKAAEVSKLWENSYRALNIAAVNELKRYCLADGLDVRDVLGLCATKPYGFQRFDPGAGVGGHCIPCDPVYLAEHARSVGAAMPLLMDAVARNAAEPDRVAERIAARLLRDATVVVLGVAYKAGVSDVRNSPAVALMTRLRERGFHVSYHDPLVPRVTLPDGAVLDSLPEAQCAVPGIDAAVFAVWQPGVAVLVSHFLAAHIVVFNVTRLLVEGAIDV